MRIAVLTPATNNTRTVYKPLGDLGHDVDVHTYDLDSAHAKLIDRVLTNEPDVVVHIGAIEAHHGRPVPKVETLARLGRAVPMVHICFDGAEYAWWPQLESYYDQGNFALQVNIDGVRTGPIGDQGLTLLCPVDPEPFEAAPAWKDRSFVLGFGGYEGAGERHELLRQLQSKRLLNYRRRDNAADSQSYHRFLMSCRAMFNHPLTGGGCGRHVKARVIEAALAGCLVVEHADSPTANWFTPNEHYCPYRTVQDIAALLSEMARNPSQYEAMAQSMRKRVLSEYSPEVFWAYVFNRLGLMEFDKDIPIPPYQEWRGMKGPIQIISSPAEQRAATRPAPRPEPSPPAASSPRRGTTPRLVATKGQTNFVTYGGLVYSVPQRLGQIDLNNRANRQRPDIRVVGREGEVTF